MFPILKALLGMQVVPSICAFNCLVYNRWRHLCKAPKTFRALCPTTIVGIMQTNYIVRIAFSMLYSHFHKAEDKYYFSQLFEISVNKIGLIFTF